MKRRNWLALIVVTVACSATAKTPMPALESAEAVLDFARSHLPPQPMQIDGVIYVKAANNFPKHKYPIQMLLEWGENRATYTISDRDSDLQQRLEVTFPRSGQPGYKFFSGADFAPAEMPDPLTKIGETDISWADLTLSFFWWPNAELVDYVSKLGQSAYMIDIPAPETEQDLSKVRLWISMKQGMMLGAEMYGKDGKRQRYMRVDSIKKVQEGLWMIKNLDLKRPGKKERTKLQLDSVTVK